MPASPMASRYTYEDSSSANHMSPYPAGMTTLNARRVVAEYPGFSPMKKVSEFHGGMPFTADSPTGSSGDENGGCMGNGTEFGFGEIEMSAVGSPTFTKVSSDESGAFMTGLGELMLSPTGSPMSAKEKRQLEMRRKRNRESMCRVRQRKRIESSELKNLLPGLEKKLTELQERKLQQEYQLAGGTATAMVQSTNGIAGAPGPGAPQAMEQLRIVEDTFRCENAWLEREIDKYEQAYVALQDEIDELREEDALTVAPPMGGQPVRVDHERDHVLAAVPPGRDVSIRAPQRD